MLIYINNISGKEFDISLGQFQVSDPLFKRELRPTFEDYVIYKVKPGLSDISLSYDRGLMLNYNLKSKTDLYFTVVNGNGIGSSVNKEFDKDSYKNFSFRVLQDLGEPFNIGIFGYSKKEKEQNFINKVYMLGLDSTLSLGIFEINLQYLYRNDKNPFFILDSQEIETSGGFIQLMYAPIKDLSNWYLFLLYNNIRSDIKELKYESITGNFTYLVGRNFKLLVEFTNELELKKNRFVLGFSTAF